MLHKKNKKESSCYLDEKKIKIDKSNTEIPVKITLLIH